jgi:hypothetical protein
MRGRGLCGLSGSLCGLFPQLDLGAGRFVAVSSAPVGLTLTYVLSALSLEEVVYAGHWHALKAAVWASEV